MRAISAPYNFVPLNEHVHIPDWSAQASHDWPFEDGYSGEIHYTLTAKSPLLVGGKQQKPTEQAPGRVTPFRLPDGRYAIPGSSLKGMLRSVVEIIGFGRMRMVDDQRLSIRDLTSAAREIYGKRMTSEVGKKTYEPKAKAGWLRYDADAGAWCIQPCDFARVEHDDLADYSKDQQWRRMPRQPKASKKYERWKKPLKISFDTRGVENHRHSNEKFLRYARALNLGNGRIEGTLVFTGQPSARIPGKPSCKHLEFIFYDEQSRRLLVPDRVWQGFVQIYENSDDWAWWKSHSKVPVFYLEEGGEVHSLGLSLMYRLPYLCSIRDAVRNSSAGHVEEPGKESGYDMADLLFGAINSDDQDSALRGRVSMEMAVAVGKPETHTCPDTILNGPKPSYYPNYIDQRGKKGNQYRTLMDEDARLRGYKRYPARPVEHCNVQPLTSDQQDNNKVKVSLETLPVQTTFEGRLVFHNLKAEELGALLWAITWGGRAELRHSLGMGKPFGFGQVCFDIDTDRSRLVPNDPSLPESPLAEKMTTLIDGFVDYMEGKIRSRGGWSRSPQMLNLMAMADPGAVQALTNGMKLAHMSLKSPQGNEFVNAKKKNNNLVLSDYAVETKFERRLERAEQERKARLAEEEKKARQAQLKKEEAERKKAFEALPPCVQARRLLEKHVDELPDTGPLIKERYQELVREINAYIEKAKGCCSHQELVEAVDFVQSLYDRYGWAMPGLKSAQKKKQEKKKRDMLDRIREGQQ